MSTHTKSFTAVRLCVALQLRLVSRLCRGVRSVPSKRIVAQTQSITTPLRVMYSDTGQRAATALKTWRFSRSFSRSCRHAIPLCCEYFSTGLGIDVYKNYLLPVPHLRLYWSKRREARHLRYA